MITDALQISLIYIYTYKRKTKKEEVIYTIMHTNNRFYCNTEVQNKQSIHVINVSIMHHDTKNFEAQVDTPTLQLVY
jgi:hypothetical protein